MASTGRQLPDAGLVVAAQHGDQQALDDVVAGSLPLVYNIVGRALRGHADVDDVVQETLVRVVRHLSDLHDPTAYRSWLAAIAIRQIRDWEQRRRVIRDRLAGLDAAQDVPDLGSDFAELTILRLGLTEQRREVAEATRWLDPDDQDLLSLWWLEETGDLDRTDVAEALGLSSGHLAVRIHRMKEQIQSSRTVVRALRAYQGCPALRTVTAGWNGVPTPLWRKRLARHVRDCPSCGRQGGALVPIERLLAGISLLPVPAGIALHAKGSALTPAAWRHALLSRPRGLLTPLVVGTAAIVLGVTAVVVTRSDDPPPATYVAPAPRPSASIAAPSPTPSPSTRPTTAAPAVPAVSSPRKGVGVWNFTGVSQALANSKAGWYYTWGTQHPGITTPRGATFVPMIRAEENVTSTELARAKAAGPYLLGFNEPDLPGQADMTVERALDLWPRLMATGSTLGSPGVAWGAADPGGWLDRFMTGARTRGHRVDFITLHWYGADFTTANATGQLRQYIEAVHERYGKPIWLTEFALIRFVDGRQVFATEKQQAAFLTAAATMLAALPYVERYAWFGLPATDKDRSGLFRGATETTAVGRAFQAAR
ncbi:sigma-70 family RNA polymerase sigma factor [Phytohabitans rumicis]|uniref:RNA polymerase sigma factor n=1 Tax=Phytohabitans rumicis TaxID=1076125 RepID=A0A6V8KWQ4_9ACTN|nr:sigma-70 family RNA polymerase sigma factor [Phytohabitans rumicis]GFJ87108.1 hypothetical protein Prum_007500 [Phytohabitans rumicis]